MEDAPTTSTHVTALIFDTETSGLFNYQKRADAEGQPRMCSVAASLVSPTGEVLHQFYRLIKPDGWIEQHINDAQMGTGAFAINGLTWERLNDEGVPAENALMEFDALVDRCEGIAAFGVNFDQKMVRAEQRRAKRPDRYGERPTFCIQKASTPLCKIPPTAKMMATGRKNYKTPKLVEAVEILLGEELPEAHDALADMTGTLKLYRFMCERPGTVVWQPQVSKLQEEG